MMSDLCPVLRDAVTCIGPKIRPDLLTVSSRTRRGRFPRRIRARTRAFYDRVRKTSPRSRPA